MNCKCGEPMREIYNEVLCFDGARPVPHALPIPAVVVFCECDTCGRNCAERSGYYADKGQVPREEWSEPRTGGEG